MEKLCSKCDKPGEFYMNQGRPRSECKDCILVKRKRDWRVNGDKILKKRKKNYRPEVRRKWGLKRYGLTYEEYQNILKEQAFSCAACRCKEPGGMGDWHVDHDHATGKIRGLLCNHCNLILGHAKDNPETLRALIEYLDKSRSI